MTEKINNFFPTALMKDDSPKIAVRCKQSPAPVSGVIFQLFTDGKMELNISPPALFQHRLQGAQSRTVCATKISDLSK